AAGSHNPCPRLRGTPRSLATKLEPSARRDFFADTQYATPSRALALVAASGSLPRIVRIVGCEAADVDDSRLGLSPPVELAPGRASEMAIHLLKEIRA